MGRHTEFTEEKAEAILDWISSGETLREFCRKEGAPNWRTVYVWLEQNESFRTRFARARDLGADAIAEQALHIADTPLTGYRTEESEQFGKKVVTEDMLGHRKLQIETRLKLLAKWNPKKYGDRIDVNHGGQDGKNPIKVEDIRDRNLGAIEALSARLAGHAAREASADREDATDPSVDAGGDA